MAAQLGNWSWFDYPAVGSTNDVAKEQSENFASPVVFTAKVQTSGRGRRGRQWVSNSGNLFMSQLLVPNIPISDLVFITSLSVAQTVQKLTSGLKINIKWPNDVLIGGKKICGILIEGASNGAVVIGVGVNLLSSPPDDMVMYPADNLAALGFKISRETFLTEYLPFFDFNLKLCQEQGLVALTPEWLSFAYRLGQSIKISQNGKVKEGIFKGIDEQGCLLLEQDNGVVKVMAGDVFV